MTRVLALATVLVGLAVPVRAAAVDESIGIFDPPEQGTDGYVCYATPIDPPKPTPRLAAAAAVPADDTCRKDILTVALPMRQPPALVPAPVDITVHYRTVVLDRPVGYVPVQDGLLTIRRGTSATQALIQLRPSQLPEERFILELFRPSFGTLVNPRLVVTIKQR